MTIVSVLRLQSMIQFANTTNLTRKSSPSSNVKIHLCDGFTEDYVTIGYWSTIEVHVGIICACMPAIRQLLQYSFPSTPRSTLASKVHTPATMSNNPHYSSSMSAPIKFLGMSKHDDSSSVHELIGVAI